MQKGRYWFVRNYPKQVDPAAQGCPSLIRDFAMQINLCEALGHKKQFNNKTKEKSYQLQP